MEDNRLNDLEELNIKEKKLERERLYYLSLYKSYDAKLSRVEPLSEEFEETFKGLDDASKRLCEITIEKVKIRGQHEYYKY